MPIKTAMYDSLKRIITITLNENDRKKEQITLKVDTAAITYNNKTNNKQLFKISITNEKELGSISGKINCKGNYMLELLDKDYTILKYFKNIKEYKIDNLKPSYYKLRIKMDINNNDIWDKGSFVNKEIPEPIIFHNEEINLRKGWEMNDINLKCPTKK